MTDATGAERAKICRLRNLSTSLLLPNLSQQSCLPHSNIYNSYQMPTAIQNLTRHQLHRSKRVFLITNSSIASKVSTSQSLTLWSLHKTCSAPSPQFPEIRLPLAECINAPHTHLRAHLYPPILEPHSMVSHEHYWCQSIGSCAPSLSRVGKGSAGRMGFGT